MAITKIHSIQRTLSKAVKYITNPKKTEEELYVYCFGCTRENLAAEFEDTRRQADRPTPVMAQHLIQSFDKDEVTPALAHEIGKELADRFTGSKHEYIIATHLDRGHIHNHIIFNHVDFVDHRCFHSDIKKLRELRALNDEICESHNLSVIKNPQGKGKSYYEWAMAKQGLSYKKRLKDNINMLIPLVESYGELLIKMQTLGYEIKTGKSDSFRMDGQERFTRTKTLGANYTKEAIMERIKNNSRVALPEVKKATYIRVWKYDQKLGLIENTGNYLLFIQSPYARERAAIADAKKLAATYNLLKEKGIDSLTALNDAYAKSKADIRTTREEIRDIETTIADINTTIKYAERVQKNKPLYQEYLKSGKSQEFYRAHRSELMLYESAQATLKEKYAHGETVRLTELKSERSALEDKKIDISASLEELRQEQQNLLTAKRNIELIMSEDQERSEEKEVDKKKKTERD